MGHKVYLGLGSNLGDRISNLKRAVEGLEKTGEISLLSSSSYYETKPAGFEAQPKFINMAIKIETSLHPVKLLDTVKKIEKEIGRAESFRWGPRNIDIDILLYGDETVKEPELEIPHPRMEERAFVLVPLSEIGGDAKHPLTSETVEEMRAKLQDTNSIKKVESEH